jgi:hypothetical protein
MNARSISKSFGGYKSVAFAHNASRSMSFKDFKSVLTRSTYSRLTIYTQSYTFANSNTIVRTERKVKLYSGGTMIMQDEKLPEVAKALGEALYLMGIQGYGLRFSGEGDSGFTEFDHHNGFDNIEECVGAAECHDEGLDTYMSTMGITAPLNLNEMVERIADDELNREYGGWENNEGGHGTIMFSLDGCEIDFQTFPCEECGNPSDDCACTFCECGQNLGVDPDEELCDSCHEYADEEDSD